MAPLLDAINGAKSRVEIAIFRFDRSEIRRLASAAAGVRDPCPHRLMLEGNEIWKTGMQLEAGITVARTADDLVRYHVGF